MFLGFRLSRIWNDLCGAAFTVGGSSPLHSLEEAWLRGHGQDSDEHVHSEDQINPVGFTSL